MAAAGAEAAPVPLAINCMTLASPQAVFARLLDGVHAAAQLPLKPQTDDADPFVQPGDHTDITGYQAQISVIDCPNVSLVCVGFNP